MTEQHPSRAALRERYLRQRMQIPPEAQKRSADKIRSHFFKHVSVPPGAVIAGYWPIRGEVDDMPILRELLRAQYTCALPQVAQQRSPLVFRAWDEMTVMTTGKFDICEPAGTQVLVPDIILVPLVAFDVTGHRLGYGGGFYDRSLDALKRIRPVVTIGLAYETQMCDELFTGPHDVRMDMIITDRKAYP